MHEAIFSPPWQHRCQSDLALTTINFFAPIFATLTLTPRSNWSKYFFIHVRFDLCSNRLRVPTNAQRW